MAAFDNIDHDSDHDSRHAALQQTFGVDGNTHRWFRSYLVGRTQYVRCGALQSLITHLLCGVAAVHLYIFDFIQLIAGHGMVCR